MKHMSINRLLIMAVIHFVLMYALMYSMVDRIENVLPSLNQIYMAAVMTSPMLILEVLLMGEMYHNKRALRIIAAISTVALVVFFVFIRQQTAIGDGEFVRSMIPHHSGAILMCEKASLQDRELIDLCAEIVVAQQAEIDDMRAILDRLE